MQRRLRLFGLLVSPRVGFSVFTLAVCTTVPLSATPADSKPSASRAVEKVSYHKQIRPIFQANCVGCHQPAKDRGKYTMTTMEQLRAGGSSTEAAVVPGDTKKSHLLSLITPVNGKARMPEGKPPLHEQEIDLVRQWITQGAVDDTPKSAGALVDAEHPPVYSAPPTIAGLDVSPDGKLLAVAGFHEVLLIDTATGKSVARLIGLSERIQSVRFSPDGKRLAAIGGNPARMGEVQIWSVETRKLLMSRPIGFDTIYGVSWSPDGSKIAFGGADNIVRAIDAKTGEQVLQQSSHNDCVLGTAFSHDGSHLASVSRDMTTKLTEVATQRFVDNITSITPGALKGGLQAVARHPTRDEIVIVGADGAPKVYRMHRQTIRVIGDDGNLIRKLPEMMGRGFSVAVSPDGKRIVAGSSLDGAGQVAVYSYEFDSNLPEDIKSINQKVVFGRSPEEKRRLEDFHVKDVKLISKTDAKETSIYAVAFHPNGKTVFAGGGDGLVRELDAATGKILRAFSPVANITRAVAVAVPNKAASKTTTANSSAAVDFIKDVNPILSRLGCNAGTCHGSAQGKAGFKLSLRGYDPTFDVRSLVDDLAGRRVNIASPDDSLMLLKATGAAPHAGGKVVSIEDPYYKTLRTWIAGGAKLNLSVPRVTAIALEPAGPVLNRAGDTVQFKATATFADGTSRDVTKEAFIETGNAEVASATPRGGLMTAVRRGEAPVLARYEGAYAAATLTVMGDREGFEWTQPTHYNRIDELVADKWKRLKIAPSGLCSDEEFLRRVYLDLTGLPPTSDDWRAFSADPKESRLKRELLVDRLIGTNDFIEHWTNKWADMLQVNRKYLGVEGSAAFRKWIRGHVERNTPYDQFAKAVVTAEGSNRDNPPAGYFKILREPEAILENTTHLFLAVRFNCNKCHDHPFERWTQDQYYETAAFFAQVGLSADPNGKGATIGGTDVESPKPIYEVVRDGGTGEVKHLRTGGVAKPTFPFPVPAGKPAGESESARRKRFADWLTSPANPYFAKSYVNRLWGYMFGAGLIEPIDDIRAGNPASNPELLDYLTAEFLKNKFDIRQMLRLMCKSRAYQLSIATNRWNEDDKRNYSHATARRLPAEALLDAVYRVVGTKSQFPGLPAGARAAELPDSGADLPSGFLSAFGRPARESSCECERSHSLQLGPVMALVNGPTIAEAISQPDSDITKLVAREKDDSKLINEIFLRALCRPATAVEIAAVRNSWDAIEPDHQRFSNELAGIEKPATARRSALEKERLAALPIAVSEVDGYAKAIASFIAAEKRRREAETRRLEADLAAYIATLPVKHAPRIRDFRTRAAWTTLMPTTSKHNAKRTKLAVANDGVIEVLEGKGKDVFTFEFDTNLEAVSAFRLEVLANPKAPNGGPGRAPDGNFVLTEFEVFELDAAGKAVKVEIADAKADFEQQEFSILKAIDGQPISDRGWAVAPSYGLTHWATFQLKQPIGSAGNARFRIVLHQQFVSPDFLLSKFRLSATSHPKPVGLSSSEELRQFADLPEKQRTPAQLAALSGYLASTDGDVGLKRNMIAESRSQPPVDPTLLALQGRAAKLNVATPEDAIVVQMRMDLEQSKKQLVDQRLTGAQDLTWALINTPAFLFNR